MPDDRQRYVEALLRSMERCNAMALKGSHTAAADRELLRALAAAIESGQEAWQHPETGGLRWTPPVSPNFVAVLILPIEPK